MLDVEYLSMTELEAGLEYIRQVLKDNDTLKMIVRRPDVDQREVLHEGQLNLQEGPVGDKVKKIDDAV